MLSVGGFLVSTSLALVLPPLPRAAHDATCIGSRRALLGTAVAATSALVLPTPAALAASDSAAFTPAAGSLKGTTIVITGANTGLGLESAKRLAAGGARIVVTARTQEKAIAAASEVTGAVPVVLDLADLDSVKTLPGRLSAALGEEMPTVDVLLNNAGVMAVPERVSTKDGFEKTVGINHLGHFALVAALLPSLERARNGFRIINVSSDAHRFADKQAIKASLAARLDPPEYAAGGWGAYGVSKAANVLFTVELQRRINEAGLKASAVSLHPGVVQTDLARYIVKGGLKGEDSHPTQEAAPPTGVGKVLKETLLDPFVLPVAKGANTQVYLAASADSNGDRTTTTGLYFDSMKAVTPAEASTDPQLARQLWELSEKLTGTQIKL